MCRYRWLAGRDVLITTCPVGVCCPCCLLTVIQDGLKAAAKSESQQSRCAAAMRKAMEKFVGEMVSHLLVVRCCSGKC